MKLKSGKLGPKDKNNNKGFLAVF
uniref:Uncharacterized protein n=1 Tax=Anguilla anguilla TaxID=7936 RepID=A0A0E9QT46_ANGAN